MGGVMSWFGWLGKAKEDVDRLATRPNARNFAGKVTLGQSAYGNEDAAVKGDRFRPERSYFSVRVAEMRLAEAGRYFTDFVPMCSCFLRYSYGRGQRTLPFVLGSETISAGLGQAADPRAARNIQFQDIYVVRNVPVKADNLTMYTALCRFKDSGFARNLLDLVADTAGIAAGPVIGAAARTGVDLTKRLATLLGTDGVETRFGMLNGNALDESGYRLFAGAASDELGVAELGIKDGRLLRRRDGVEATVDDADYLVLALEYLPTLVDEDFAQISILPFHGRFDEARTKLLGNDRAGADAALRQLLIDLATSPDVSEADRLALIASYRGAFDQWADAAGGRAKTMGAGGVPMFARFPTVAKPEVIALLQAARAETVATDGRLRRDGIGLSDAAPDNIRGALAKRALAVNRALAHNNATDSALAGASSALLQTML
jgi:hypothetical protein